MVIRGETEFLSNSEASTESDPQISVVCGCSSGQRGDLVWEENPHHLPLRKSEIKAFPRRTSQLLFTILSTRGRREPLIMFWWSGIPKSCKWSCKLVLFYSLRVYNDRFFTLIIFRTYRNKMVRSAVSTKCPSWVDCGRLFHQMTQWALITGDISMNVQHLSFQCL